MKPPIGAGFSTSPFRLRSARSGGCGMSVTDCRTCRRDWNLPSKCGIPLVEKRSAPHLELAYSMRVERLICLEGCRSEGADPRNLARVRDGDGRTLALGT